MRKILSIITALIVILWLLINIFSSMNISFFGLRIFRIVSGSMEPTLKINDLIMIKESKEYKDGDIVTFYDEEAYTTHRIIEISGEEITTKGDNNNSKDPNITKEKIIGKMIYKFEILSFMSYLLSSPNSWGIIFIIGVLIIVAIPDKRQKGKHSA